MHRFRGFIALLFTLVLTSTPAAFAGPRNTAELKENGRGSAQESATLVQAAGKDFSITAVDVRVGDSLPINNVIVLVKAGEVQAQRSVRGGVNGCELRDEPWCGGERRPAASLV